MLYNPSICFQGKALEYVFSAALLPFEEVHQLNLTLITSCWRRDEG